MDFLTFLVIGLLVIVIGGLVHLYDELNNNSRLDILVERRRMIPGHIILNNDALIRYAYWEGWKDANN